MQDGVPPGGGPEVPTHASLLLTFRRCFLDLLVLFDRSTRRWKVDDCILSDCDPTVWLSVPAHIPSDCVYQGEVEARLYIFVHNNVSPSSHPSHSTDQPPVPFVLSMQYRLQIVEGGYFRAPEWPMARTIWVELI